MVTKAKNQYKQTYMQQLPPQFIDDLKSRLQISQIVGKHVKLKHKSGGNYSGLCPFHKEKTPSFSVNDNKGFYHCFGCGVSGDSIKFITEIEGLAFFEAVSKLADMAGLPLPAPSKQQQRQYAKQITLYDVCEEACKWFEKQLTTAQNKAAAAYLTQRSISTEIIQKFRLGYAPPSGKNSLKAAMIKKNFSEQQLIDAGLVIQPENNKQSYDRFRGRVIFPIMDAKGKVVAFGGRIIGDGQPKYLNSPETPLFHKGNILYGFHLARQSAYDSGEIIVTEGYMDVIAMFQAGITNVVAPLGTAITDNHLQIMWRIAKEPTLCMDGDEAGKRAMKRVALNSLSFLEPGYSLKFATLPSGKDPDDVIKSSGANELKKILASSIPLSELVWRITRANKSLTTPEQNASFEHDLMSLCEEIEDETVATYYRRHFKNKLWEGQKFTKKKSANQNIRPLIATNDAGIDRYSRILLKIILYHPELLNEQQIEDEFTRIEIKSHELNNLRNFIFDLNSSQENVDFKTIESSATLSNITGTIKSLENSTNKDPSIEPESPAGMVKIAWEYNISLYNSELIDIEYTTKAENNKNISDSALKQLNALQKDKDMLKKLVKEKYLAYEAALEDY